jgi:Nickel/cobalt transporter regulator
MLRVIVIAATFALASSTWAVAQGNNNDHRHPPPGKPGPIKPGPGPLNQQHGPPKVIGNVHPGGPPGRQFSYRGHTINRVHLAPFAYPSGWAYRRWAIGAALPALFLAPAYYYADWATLGLESPQPGFQWVRYGPDLLLVNVTTGQVVDVAYGVFY